VTLWLLYLEFLQPQSHREHRGRTEKKFKLKSFLKKLVVSLFDTSISDTDAFLLFHILRER
jgi:hypothetical protein